MPDLDDKYTPVAHVCKAAMPPSTPKSRARKGRASASPAPIQAPSPAVDDVVLGHLTKSEWIDMLTGEEGEEVVAEILDEMMNRVMERCYNVYLNRQLIPFTVSRARDTLVQVLKWQFLVQDRGEGPEGADLWEADAEPPPCMTDSWAEGSIPVCSRSPAPPSPTTQAGPHMSKFQLRKTAPPVDTAETAEIKGDTEPRSETEAVYDSTKQRCEEKGAAPMGLRSSVSSPLPPPGKREGRGKWQPSQQDGVPLLRTPPPFLPGQPLICTPSSDAQDATVNGPKALPRPRPPDVPPVQRPNPHRPHRRYFSPGFEVLKSSPAPSRGKGGQKQKPLMPFEGISKWGAPAGAVYVFSTRNIQDGGLPQGYTPLSASVLLDTMKLSPGVSIKAPAKPTKELPFQPIERTTLMPIRGTPITPSLTRNQLILGTPPQDRPHLLPREMAESV